MLPLDDERHRAELHPIARTHLDGLADQPPVQPGAVVGPQVAEHPAVLAPDQQGMHPGHGQVGQAQVAVAGPADGEPDPVAGRENQRRRDHGRRGVLPAGRGRQDPRRHLLIRGPSDLLRPRDVPAAVRPALERLGVLSPQHGLDPGHQPWPTRRQVGEQADQLTAAPRVQGALHAVHEGLVGQPTLGELVPELADRVIALRVGSTE